VSFLPSFAVPYKHYSSSVINQYLDEILRLSSSINSVYKHHYMAAYTTVRTWLNQFTDNGACLYQDGITRLSKNGYPKCSGTPSSIYGFFLNFAAKQCSSGVFVTSQVFSIVQVPLAHHYPPIGLFRPCLLPISF